MQTHPSCDKAYHRARFAQSICVRISQKSEIFRRIPVPSRTVLKLVDASSGMMMLSDQAARSMV
jgi:hypothetical protein